MQNGLVRRRQRLVDLRRTGGCLIGHLGAATALLSCWAVASAALAADAGGPARQTAVETSSPDRAMAVKNLAYTTNQNSETVSIVGLGGRTAPMSVLAEIKVPGKPAGIALSPDRKTIYVTAPEAKELVVIDASSRKIRTRIPAGQGPLGIAVNPVTGAILVADRYEHKLRVIDPATLQLTAEVATGKSPSGIAITRDGKLILTADRDSNQVSIIDAATLQVTAAVPVGDRPFGITVDAAGTRAYTANVRSDDVSVVDIPSARTIATYKVGRRPYAVALASGKAFVTDQYAGTVTVVDLSSGKTIKSIPVGEHPEGIEADASGRHLYVACWMENTLERIDSTTLKVTGKVEVGDGPRAFGAFLDAAGQDAARASPKDAH